MGICHARDCNMDPLTKDPGSQIPRLAKVFGNPELHKLGTTTKLYSFSWEKFHSLSAFKAEKNGI